MTIPGAVGVGLLPDMFPDGVMRHYELDLEHGTVELTPGLTVPLEPFLGFMAVAPRDEGPHNSIPRGPHGEHRPQGPDRRLDALPAGLERRRALLRGRRACAAGQRRAQRHRARGRVRRGAPPAHCPLGPLARATAGGDRDVLAHARVRGGLRRGRPRGDEGDDHAPRRAPGNDPGRRVRLLLDMRRPRVTQAVNTVVGVHARLAKELIA